MIFKVAKKRARVIVGCLVASDKIAREVLFLCQYRHKTSVSYCPKLFSVFLGNKAEMVL